MVKTILLTQNKIAFVDDEDFEKLNKYKWYAFRSYSGKYYARRKKSKKNIAMHREILNFPPMIDHINRDGLDNRRSNLRVCDNSQNRINSKMCRHNSSGFRGVSWFKITKKWVVHIAKDNKKITVGYFTDKIKAAEAYDAKAKQLHGEFAILNFPIK